MVGRPTENEEKEGSVFMSDVSVRSSQAVLSDNDNATCRVSAAEKKSTFSVSVVASGYCICMSGFFTGAAMAAGLSLRSAIIAAIIGNLILSLYGGAMGAAGAREGVATSLLARHSFGRQGSKLIGLIVALVMAGWFSVQVGFFGSTINAMFPNAGFITSKYVAAFWGGILMMITAYYGYKGLNILSFVAVPLIAIIAVIGIVVAINHAGGWGEMLLMTPTAPMTIGAAIVIVVGSFAGGGCGAGGYHALCQRYQSSLVLQYCRLYDSESFYCHSGFSLHHGYRYRRSACGVAFLRFRNAGLDYFDYGTMDYQ